jgi:hypothetical protein
MTGCERCGRLDSSLRASSFIYAFSLVLVTFTEGAGAGIYCSGCRKRVALKYTLISAILGWWGIPWGPIRTVQAIGRNSAGGYQDRDLNAELLRAVAAELIERGERAGAVDALETSLRLRDDGSVRQVLWSLQGEALGATDAATLAAPAYAGASFRPGEVVRTAGAGVQLFREPATTEEPVGVLGSEAAVVTRTQGGWIELQVPGGKSGWVPESAVRSD